MSKLHDKIAAQPFFQHLKPEHLAILAECASEVEFKAGEVLFRENEPADRFFLIESGWIALETRGPSQNSHGSTALVQNLKAGDVLGWSWLFPPFIWHFQARALESGSMIVLRGAYLLVAAERDPEFGYELMKRIAQVMIRRLQVTRKQLLAAQLK